MVVPLQGSCQLPQTPAGQVVAGVQQVRLLSFEHCSPLAQFEVQVTTVPVHGSVKVPQKFVGQVVFGVQHTFGSVPPSSEPHCVPAAQGGLLQVTALPVQGSVQVAPHQSSGHSTAGVQHVLPSAFEQTSGEAQFEEQLSVVFVHGSKTEPQKPAGHVAAVQQ
jgi:hypothetical protein